ncbi:MAG: WecB/TagA/CpsF family glycosyltransferase [Opitutales bacterium]
MSRPSENPSPGSVRILGLDFFDGPPEAAVDRALRGGLTCAPSGPGLATLDRQATYRSSLRAADTLLADSGFMVLVWRLLGRKPPRRISGLTFMRLLVPRLRAFTPKDLFWVFPHREDGETMQYWLNRQGIPIPPESCYDAPWYPSDQPIDAELEGLLKQRRPKVVVLTIAGGKQEILGAWLSQRLPNRPAIICTGAALAFMTGSQVAIPGWVDRCYLGWFWRILSDPPRYGLRFLRAFRLLKLLLVWRNRLPETR